MDPFSLQTHTPEDPVFRSQIEAILAAGLQAADPYRCVKEAIDFESPRSLMKTRNFQNWKDDIACIAVGKAAQPMMSAARDVLGDQIIRGICVSKSSAPDAPTHDRVVFLAGGHPHPTQASIEAAGMVMRIFQEIPDDLPILWLISGGGSALLTLPFEGISLTDYSELNRLMLSNNLTIDQVNIVRKHIDRVKGGRLLRKLGKRSGAALILSDVVSGDLATIASGITAPDHSTFTDAIDVLIEAEIWDEVPAAIQTHLKNGQAGMQEETLRAEEFAGIHFTNLIVGGVRQSLEAMRLQAVRLGWYAEIREPLIERGIVMEAERILADIRKASSGSRRCLLYGGEGTVQLTGSGRGGRNSHLAALLAQGIAGRGDRCVVVAFASDGDDGNSGAAGAIIDGKTYTRAYQSLLHFGYDIENSNTGHLFSELDDAIVTGYTGTNVNDWVLVFQSEDEA